MTHMFQKYFKNSKQLPSVFKKAVRYELFSLDADTYTHKACKILASNKDIVMLHIRWDFLEMIPTLGNPDAINSINDIMECGFYNKKLEYLQDFAWLQLIDYMSERKIIYVVLNIENYEMDSLETGNEYGHHCTALIFYPKETGDYDCFYITSHGEAMMRTMNFDVRISRRRYRRISFDEPIDVVCVKQYLAFLQNYLKEFECNIKIHYDGTKNHNYYGPNLQCGDNYGVCFAFPLIIWYYLSNFYKKGRHLISGDKILQVPPMEHLLKQKDLIFMVNTCFIAFHKKYEDILMERIGNKKPYSLRGVSAYILSGEENTYKKVHKYTKLEYEDIVLNRRVEAIIKKSSWVFIKRIAVGIVSLITEPYINKIIC